jgi:hypothetical protein
MSTLLNASLHAKEAANRAIAHLLESCEHGYWGYHPGHKPSTEATAWCAIACRHAHEQVVEQSFDYLLSQQNDDGGWSTGPHIGRSDWSSAPALLALRILMRDRSRDCPQIDVPLTHGFNYLFDNRAHIKSPVLRLMLLLIGGAQALRFGCGWPWTPGCWNWVEPSAYSLLALKIPKLPPAEEFQIITKRAHRFFIEHACAAGGWNHGSNRCLGSNLPPYAVTTAEALLALQDIKEHAVVKNGLTFLEKISAQHESAMACAWSILARNAYGHETPHELTFLLQEQHADGSFGPNLMVTGLAVCALSAVQGENPLIISS